MFMITIMFILPNMMLIRSNYTGYALNRQSLIVIPNISESSIEDKIEATELITVNVPLKETNGSWFKPYMDYRKMTDETSKQYKFINQENVSVNEKGMLMLDEEFYCVALGYYFGDIGSKYIITLETGQKIKVVKAESKNPIHTDNEGYLAQNGHIVEFLVDTNSNYLRENKVFYHGNIGALEMFKGNIIQIEKIL